MSCTSVIRNISLSSYVLNTGMVNENTGHLKVSRPSLLQSRESFLAEWDTMKRHKKPTNVSVYSKRENSTDEAMPDNIFDDSHRPWVKTAAKVEEKDEPLALETDKPTFFRKPKLFLIRKEKSPDGSLTASYIRPLEYGYMPTLPLSLNVRRMNDTTRDTMGRESILGQSMYASRASESFKTTKDSKELLRKFVERPDDQAGAIIYGRNIMMTEKGRQSLDNNIAKAASELSNVRLQNAVSTNRSSFRKDEMSRGKFLSRPQTLN